MPTSTSFALDKKLFLVRQEIPQKSAQPAKKVETPTNHLLIVDCSGSMYGELPKIRAQLKARLPKILKEKDTFSIIWFSGRGQFGALLEAEPVATLTDLAQVNRAIDRWLTPQGLTGFKEPLEEVERLVGRVKAKSGGNPFALLFLSDGHDNCWNRGDVLKAVEKAAGAVQSATFVEYGYYADRPLLTAMAEKAGGQLIFAQDFDQWEPSFDAIVQKRPTGAPRIEVKVKGDPIRGFAWTAEDGDLVTYGLEGGSVRLPATTAAIWYVSPSPVGTTTATLDAGASYAALSLFSTRMAPEVVLPLLKATGDVSFIKKFGGLYGKQKYSEFMDAAKAAVFDPKLRLTEGCDPKLIPAEDAFTVLDLLKLLASDDSNRVLLDHPRFKYSRIGRGRVDASSVLTPEEEAEVATLTAEIAKVGKDVKKLLEINTKIGAITSKLQGALKFEADPAPEGYPVSSLTYNEEKPNISMLVKKTGTVDISGAKAPAGLPAKFETFVFRNYAMVKDGLVNVEVLPVKLASATLEALFKAHGEGRMPDNVVTGEDGVTIINLKALPVINRQMVKAVSAKALFEDEWSLLKTQAAQKVYNTVAKESFGTKKSEGFVEKYGQEAADWLKEQGFTDYSGFGPKMVQAESTDVYRAKELSVAIKGFSAIPSLNDFKKQAAKGKFTPSASLMSSAWADVEAFLATPDGKDTAKFEAWVKGKQKALDAGRRTAIFAKAQQVFSIIVGQVWPSEFSSMDENSLTLNLDGQALACTLTAKEVDVKV